ncbi:MAG: FHA domain-containing protein, partial [Alphaproteobacteria bacterium]|nr:FHA domain-containing protein [Alphaproteobacteria bacterium]
MERSETLEAETIRIGRGSDSELHLTDGRVLLHHATISLENGALVVTADPPAEIEYDGIVEARIEL